MKVFALILFLLALACSTDAQTSESLFKKHAVGLNVSNDLTSQFEDNGLYPYGSNHARYGYSAALLYQYRPIKWFSMETGFEYNYTNKHVVDGLPYDAEFIRFVDAWDMVFSMEFNRSISRMAIPLNFRWHWHSQRWGFYALTGVVFTVNHIRHYDFEGYRKETHNYISNQDFKDNFAMGVSAGIGTEYSITPNWMLRMEPRFRVYNVATPDRTNYYGYTPPTEHYWAMGLNLGLYYGFGK